MLRIRSWEIRNRPLDRYFWIDQIQKLFRVLSYATMLWTIAVILLILWLLGFSFHVAGAFVHILLVIALVVVVIRLVTGQAP